MQVVVVVPENTSPASLAQKICGVGLLERTLATAERAGAEEILLIWPYSVPIEESAPFLCSPVLRKKSKIRVLQVRSFEPSARSHWAILQDLVQDRFIWLPWNWVTYARALANLSELEESPRNWSAPNWITKTELLSGMTPAPRLAKVPEGVAVTSKATAAAAERFLVARSGKVLDGIHTSFNRWLCRPAVRWLTHTRATPNMVTLGGVVVAI